MAQIKVIKLSNAPLLESTNGFEAVGFKKNEDGTVDLVRASMSLFKGENGDDGYQVWISQGNTGTYADYFASLKGLKGDTGAQGQKGDTGAQGIQGVKGDTGAQGPQGLKGDTGSTGPKGDTGLQGPKGDTGLTGPKGDTGAKGETGLQGQKGDTGLNPYQFWLTQGNTGTEADYLVWIQSPANAAIADIQAVQTSVTNSESARVTAESSRVTAENARVTAENARKVWEAYSGAKAYVIGNKVSYLGSSYICILTSTGKLPTNATYWTLIASKGDKGDQGIKGDTGLQGLNGDTGAKGDTGEQGLQGIQGPKGDTGAKGDQGIQGIQGVKGDTGIQGPKGANWRSTYNASITYNVDDVVEYLGSSYICILQGLNKPPTNSPTYWAMLAQRGNDGAGSGDMSKTTYDTNSNGIVDNAEKVNNLTVETAVPAGAKFTDTVYTHPSGDGNLHIPATGTTNNGKVLKAGATAGSPTWGIDNDTITTINGKTGAIVKADIVALGIPAQDTVYSHPNHSGDVTSTGDGATVIGSGKVTNAKLASATANSIKGNNTGAAAAVKDLTVAEVLALLNVADGANNYIHPAAHAPSIITQDASNRFVTDTEKSTWNGKQNALGFTPINATEKGAVNGVAQLDSSGKVPSSQLPSYVDDVIEYAAQANFPATGESGKIYIALDTNVNYRWGGSEYVEISASLALGETSSTAYRGDRGKIAYDHSQAAHAPTTAQKNSDITKAEIEAKLTGAITTHTHALASNAVAYANVGTALKQKSTVTASINLSAAGIGEITLSANTSFSFSGYELNKSYLLKVTSNGFTPSFATAARHAMVEGNATLGTTGIYYINLLCINATSGSEVLLTTIMKGV